MDHRYGPQNAIDNNWYSKTMTDYSGDWKQGTWITVSLGDIYCVQSVEGWYFMQLPQ